MPSRSMVVSDCPRVFDASPIAAIDAELPQPTGDLSARPCRIGAGQGAHRSPVPRSR
jgi:hypothetical protein